MNFAMPLAGNPQRGAQGGGVPNGDVHVRLRLERAAFTLDVDLHLPAHGITVLFGPSGCGKTSVLRCIAGLERARDARVLVQDQLWQDDAAGVFLPTWRRSLGYVFQESSLFEHLDVGANLRYGLRRAQSSDGAAMLDEAITLLGIGDLLRRRPLELSGGERQRVAIARALAMQPRLLLLDEPLASLDQARKQEALPWLERLRTHARTPMVYVTHAVQELTRLADHVVVLDQGRVRTQGALGQVLSSLDHPALVGEEVGAVLAGEVVEHDRQWHLSRLGFDGGSLWLRDAGLAIGHTARLRVLASDVSLSIVEPSQSSILNVLPGHVDAFVVDVHPSQVLVRVRVGASVLLARLTARSFNLLQLSVGRAVWVQVKSVALVQ